MRDVTFSIMHTTGVPVFLRQQRIRNQEISVLVFHRISDEIDPLWPPMPVDSFRILMRELSERAHVVYLEDLHSLTEYPEKPVVAITFDDGYQDFLKHALPVLTEYQLPSHHNICPQLIDRGTPPWTQYINVFMRSQQGMIELPNGTRFPAGRQCRERDFLQMCQEVSHLDDDMRVAWIDRVQQQVLASSMPKLMSWDEIRVCARAGVRIGSHGMDHADLSQMSDREQLRQQIDGSRHRIAQEVGVMPQVFAFPSGTYAELALDVVDESGYRMALLCQDKVARLTGAMGRNGMQILPRITMCRRTWKEEHLRVLGFHQKLRSWATQTSYVLQDA